jgi:hypothetical protein
MPSVLTAPGGRPLVGRRAAASLLAVAVPGASLAGGVKASSELTDADGVKHTAERAVDGLLTTSWAEGVAGVGEGSWLELRFDRPVEVESVSLWPGDLSRGQRSLKENGRPHTVTVQLVPPSGGESVTAEARIRDGAEHGEQRVDVAVKGTAAAIRLTIDQAYAGFLRNDTYLAEVAVNFAAGAPAAAARVDAWRASTAGEKAAAAHKEQVVERFDRVDEAEFGDREAFGDLMGWAADGAPYLRERVQRDVPAGFRVQALPPDEVALEALLKLKDPNAIPAIQLAALRSSGPAEKKLKATRSYFEAFAELKGGGRRSLPVWGAEGWEKGALRAFGEPFGVVLGAEERLYVADVANHRVSVFDQDEGRLQATFGAGKPVVTDVWFGKRRKHYVAGNEPSDGDDGFTNPVDVAIGRGPEGERLVVLDALGHVRVLDPATGATVAHWQVSAPVKTASAGAGGAATVVVVKSNVVVTWGSSGRVYDFAGDETARWDVPSDDGTPHDAAVAKGGKVALALPGGVGLYGIDGFRHQQILASADLPPGYADYAIAFDEKGKLWTLTDHGFATKWKKPGVKDFQIRWSPVGVTLPRFAVLDDVLWVVHDGTISRVDAREVRSDGEKSAFGDE